MSQQERVQCLAKLKLEAYMQLVCGWVTEAQYQLIDDMWIVTVEVGDAIAVLDHLYILEIEIFMIF